MRASSDAFHRRGERITVNVRGVNKPEDCRHFLECAIKYILFGKNVIPYPYNVLSDVVKRSINEDGMSSREVMFESLHKRKASSMIMKVNDILQGLDNELNSNGSVQIKEVAFLIGPTINCPKEVYMFKLPNSYGVINASIPVKRDLARYIFLNEEFMKFTCKSIQRTNMYVIIKKPKGGTSTWFHPMPHYSIPLRAPCALTELLCTASENVNQRLDNHVEKIDDTFSVQEMFPKIYIDQTSPAAENSELPVSNDQIDRENSPVSISGGNASNDIISHRNTVVDEKDSISSGRLLNPIMQLSNSSSPQDANICKSWVTESSANGKNLVGNSNGMFMENEYRIKNGSASSANGELIWYIAKEYLPCFQTPKYCSRPSNHVKNK